MPNVDLQHSRAVALHLDVQRPALLEEAPLVVRRALRERPGPAEAGHDRGAARPYTSPVNPTLRYCLLAALWACATFWLARELPRQGYWLLVLGVLLLAMPVALSGLYGLTISRLRRLQLFQARGWLFRLLSGRLLAGLLWVAIALLGGFLTLLQLPAWDPLDWLAFLAAAPLFLLLFRAFRRLLARELRPWLVTSVALAWARALCPLLLLSLQVALLKTYGSLPLYVGLQEAIDAEAAVLAAAFGPALDPAAEALSTASGNALLAEAGRWLAVYEGAKAYALGNLGLDASWALALALTGGYVAFYNACAFLSCFLIPGAEYRRLFAPLREDAEAPPPGPRRLAAWTAVLAFLVLFVYLPLMAYLEAWMQLNPSVPRARAAFEAAVVPRAERIGEALFREGTLAEIAAARLEALGQAEASLVRVEAEADRAFDALAGRVDGFLDWYYSLGGEYGRILTLMSGELEDYLAAKLEEALGQGDAFAGVQRALDEALAGQAEVQRLYRERVDGILRANRLYGASGEPLELLADVPLGEVIAPPVHEDLLGLEGRLAAGAGGAAAGGLVTATVVKKVIAKAVGKNAFKLAAKSLGKLVLGKTAGSGMGAGAGAAAGAALGSVVPGIDTAIGAVAGGIAGALAVGVGVDKLLIELEEAVNREAFRAELLQAIDEAHLEFRAQLRPGAGEGAAPEGEEGADPVREAEARTGVEEGKVSDGEGTASPR